MRSAEDAVDAVASAASPPRPEEDKKTTGDNKRAGSMPPAPLPWPMGPRANGNDAPSSLRYPGGTRGFLAVANHSIPIPIPPKNVSRSRSVGV